MTTLTFPVYLKTDIKEAIQAIRRRFKESYQKFNNDVCEVNVSNCQAATANAFGFLDFLEKEFERVTIEQIEADGGISRFLEIVMLEWEVMNPTRSICNAVSASFFLALNGGIDAHGLDVE